MKKLIAAVAATAALAAYGGLYAYNHYTIVDGSILSDEFIYHEIATVVQVGRTMAMQGYMAGLKEGGETCKSHT